MTELNDFIAHLNADLKEHSADKEPFNLYGPIRYILNSGGKRIRPLLIFAGYRCFSDSEDANLLKLARAVEMFHNFTLMHDDIMDNAGMRRGRETVHVKWDTPTAILSGDLLLIQVYQLLNDIAVPAIQTAFNKMAVELCEGQMYDMNFEHSDYVENDSYLKMIRGKTAELLGFCLESGAILAGQAEKIRKEFYQLGIELGLTFQLMDDYLDSFGEEDKVGKQIGGDILERKKTYLWNAMYSNLKPKQIDELDFIYRSCEDREIIENVKLLMKDSGADAKTRECIKLHESSAAAILEKVQARGNTEYLRYIFNMLSERSF